jgi:hypothetical protein
MLPAALWPLGSTQSLTEMSTRNISWGVNLTTFMCWLSRNLGAPTSWNPQGLSRPVMGLLYLYLFALWLVTHSYIFYTCCPLANKTKRPNPMYHLRGSTQYRQETKTEAHWFSCHHMTISALLELTWANICVFYYGGKWMVCGRACTDYTGEFIKRK